jgi:hypothetical protein
MDRSPIRARSYAQRPPPARWHQQRISGLMEIYGHWENEWNADPSRIRTDVYYLLSDDSGS